MAFDICWLCLLGTHGIGSLCSDAKLLKKLSCFAL